MRIRRQFWDADFRRVSHRRDMDMQCRRSGLIMYDKAFSTRPVDTDACVAIVYDPRRPIVAYTFTTRGHSL